MNRVLEDGTVYGLRGRPLVARPDKDGYLRVMVKEDGKWYPRGVHRLVAQRFIPNPDNKPCVNHIDGDKLNNHVSNLEWCTVAENNRHAFDSGLKEGAKRPVVADRGGMGMYYPSCQDAVSQGFTKSTISQVCNGKMKTHKGYTWSFV